MKDKTKELKYRTDKLRWDMFKEKEVSKLISHIFNTTKVIFEQNMTRQNDESNGKTLDKNKSKRRIKE